MLLLSRVSRIFHPLTKLFQCVQPRPYESLSRHTQYRFAEHTNAEPRALVPQASELRFVQQVRPVQFFVPSPVIISVVDVVIHAPALSVRWEQEGGQEEAQDEQQEADDRVLNVLRQRERVEPAADVVHGP